MVAILLSSCPNAHSQTEQNVATVQYLRNLCKDIASGTHFYCIGYITGVGQMMAMNALMGRFSSKDGPTAKNYFKRVGLCVANTDIVPSPGAMIQAFLNWSEMHPDHWGDNSEVGVVNALSATWPCR